MAGLQLFMLRGGDNGYFFVKLDFEIAVDQQTRTSDRTFEGVPDPNRQTVLAGQPRPYLVQIRPNLAKYPEHALNMPKYPEHAQNPNFCMKFSESTLNRISTLF